MHSRIYRIFELLLYTRFAGHRPLISYNKLYAFYLFFLYGRDSFTGLKILSTLVQKLLFKKI